MVYLPTFTIKINQMYVNIPYMDPIGYIIYIYTLFNRENSDRQKAEMPRYDLLKKGAQGASPPNVLDKP